MPARCPIRDYFLIPFFHSISTVITTDRDIEVPQARVPLLLSPPHIRCLSLSFPLPWGLRHSTTRSILYSVPHHFASAPHSSRGFSNISSSLPFSFDRCFHFHRRHNSPHLIPAVPSSYLRGGVRALPSSFPSNRTRSRRLTHSFLFLAVYLFQFSHFFASFALRFLHLLGSVDAENKGLFTKRIMSLLFCLLFSNINSLSQPSVAIKFLVTFSSPVWLINKSERWRQ